MEIPRHSSYPTTNALIDCTYLIQAPSCRAPIPYHIPAGVRHRHAFATYFDTLRRIWTLFASFGIFCVTFILNKMEQNTANRPILSKYM